MLKQIINKITRKLSLSVAKHDNLEADINTHYYKHPESKLAHELLDGLHGLEIGGAAHNPFGLNTKNVDFTSNMDTIFKLEEIKLCGEAMPVDIVACGDEIPVDDESQDFVISSHVLEHFADPIKALKEWYRVVKNGGYIYTIFPHKERTFDKDRERTKLEELIQFHKDSETSGFVEGHHTVWITEDAIELVKYLGWNLVAYQDIDDKVGNGFTFVIKKDSAKHQSISKVQETKQFDRTKCITYSCNIEGVGLEIGPSYNPVVAKKDGYNIETLDHASKDELREKYKDDPNVDINNIEEVDYVWSGEPLDELTGKTNHYDYIIASHVIEHTPNLVTFLQQCQNMLKKDGVLALVVPDKRLCFDYLRPYSTTGQVLQAWHENRVFHSPGTIYDFNAQFALRGKSPCWNNSYKEQLNFVNTPELAINIMKEAMKQDKYIDAHNWCFTPASFRLIMGDLAEFSLIEFSECSAFDSPLCEFIISYRKDGKSAPIDRMALSLAAVNGE